jgi:hypothetical protein
LGILTGEDTPVSVGAPRYQTISPTLTPRSGERRTKNLAEFMGSVDVE